MRMCYSIVSGKKNILRIFIKKRDHCCLDGFKRLFIVTQRTGITYRRRKNVKSQLATASIELRGYFICFFNIFPRKCVNKDSPWIILIIFNLFC